MESISRRKELDKLMAPVLEKFKKIPSAALPDDIKEDINRLEKLRNSDINMVKFQGARIAIRVIDKRLSEIKARYQSLPSTEKQLGGTIHLLRSLSCSFANAESRNRWNTTISANQFIETPILTNDRSLSNQNVSTLEDSFQLESDLLKATQKNELLHLDDINLQSEGSEISGIESNSQTSIKAVTSSEKSDSKSSEVQKVAMGAPDSRLTELTAKIASLEAQKASQAEKSSKLEADLLKATQQNELLCLEHIKLQSENEVNEGVMCQLIDKQSIDQEIPHSIPIATASSSLIECIICHVDIFNTEFTLKCPNCYMNFHKSCAQHHWAVSDKCKSCGKNKSELVECLKRMIFYDSTCPIISVTNADFSWEAQHNQPTPVTSQSATSSTAVSQTLDRTSNAPPKFACRIPGCKLDDFTTVEQLNEHIKAHSEQVTTSTVREETEIDVEIDVDIAGETTTDQH